jgi:hypothetical protein
VVAEMSKGVILTVRALFDVRGREDGAIATNERRTGNTVVEQAGVRAVVAYLDRDIDAPT